MHEMGRASVSQRRHVQQRVDLLPLGSPVAGGQARLQLLVGVRCVRLHGVNQISHCHHYICRQLHQHVVVFGVRRDHVRTAKGGLCLVKPGLWVRRPELRKFDGDGVDVNRRRRGCGGRRHAGQRGGNSLLDVLLDRCLKLLLLLR